MEYLKQTSKPVPHVLPLSEAVPSFSSSRILIFCVKKFTDKHEKMTNHHSGLESMATAVDTYFKSNIFPSVHCQDIEYQNILFLRNCVTQPEVLSLSHNISC